VQYAVFAGACLIWGTTFLAIRVGNQSLPPEWAATLRLSMAAPLLALIVTVRRDRWPRGGALQGAILFGLFNFGANLGLLYWGERVVPSGIAAVLYATVPLTTTFVAAAFGVERLALRKVLTAIMAIGGVAIIFAGEMRLDVPFVGLLAVFLAASAAALSNVLLKRAPAQPSVFATNAVGAAAGAVVTLVASLVLGEDHALPATFAAIWPVVYLTLAGSLGAYVLWTWLVLHWSATNASYVGVVVPVIAVIVGAIALGETRSADTYVGALIVLVAVVAALRGGASAH
jgi:drug/metabolite transporter (DMT)-like permease